MRCYNRFCTRLLMTLPLIWFFAAFMMLALWKMDLIRKEHELANDDLQNANAKVAMSVKGNGEMEYVYELDPISDGIQDHRRDSSEDAIRLYDMEEEFYEYGDSYVEDDEKTKGADKEDDGDEEETESHRANRKIDVEMDYDAYLGDRFQIFVGKNGSQHIIDKDASNVDKDSEDSEDDGTNETKNEAEEKDNEGEGKHNDGVMEQTAQGQQHQNDHENNENKEQNQQNLDDHNNDGNQNENQQDVGDHENYEKQEEDQQNVDEPDENQREPQENVEDYEHFDKHHEDQHRDDYDNQNNDVQNVDGHFENHKEQVNDHENDESIKDLRWNQHQDEVQQAESKRLAEDAIAAAVAFDNDGGDDYDQEDDFEDGAAANSHELQDNQPPQQQSQPHDDEDELALRDIKAKLADPDPWIMSSQNRWPSVYNGSNGAFGRPVKIKLSDLTSAERERYNQGRNRHGFSLYVSDVISVRRDVRDVRDKECRLLDYHGTLPTTSVVIIFRNEAWSVLLRTVHSVLDRSPADLLKEVILVDDSSVTPEFDFLKRPLETYMAQYPKVRIGRTPKRSGLIRARLLGAQMASADTLTFLDSHCEVSKDWLPPLMARIADDRTHVVMPIIDVIDKDTFALRAGGSGMNPQVGSFSWNMMFKWETASQRERNTRRANTDPVRSPTMAGGLFSIDRKYFYDIGSYDTGMDVWGGENIEMSFRIWMCGGSLELIPCSRVGHIFRDKNPNLEPGDAAVITKNTMRMAEVWMDEYKEIYYKRAQIRPMPRLYGDISERVKLREHLKCHSFKWYLRNVYPEKFVPTESLYSGQLQNEVRVHVNALCLDEFRTPPRMLPCQSVTKTLYLSFNNELRYETKCLDYSEHLDIIKFTSCHGLKGDQLWEEQGLSFHHVQSNKCLTMAPDGENVLMKSCKDKPEQRWHWRKT